MRDGVERVQVSGGIDTSFEFHSDTPAGKDPAVASPTLRRYHELLWCKPLPSGDIFTLAREDGEYLVHRSPRWGVFSLTSDAITTNLVGRAWRVIQAIPEGDQPEDLGYTIGCSVLFPGDRISGQMTLNGARGFNQKIADRFDLTLECIRRHYLRQSNPLGKVLSRYQDFFALFEDFNGYVDFFLLQDLLEDGERTIRFFSSFDDFNSPAVPRTVENYLHYVQASNDFIRARNRRIEISTVGTRPS